MTVSESVDSKDSAETPVVRRKLSSAITPIPLRPQEVDESQQPQALVSVVESSSVQSNRTATILLFIVAILVACALKNNSIF